MLFKFKDKIKINNILLKSLYILVGFLFLFVIINLLGFSVDKNEIDKPNNKTYAIYPVTLPDSLNFAGENVPLENFDVYESLDKEFTVNTYWQSQMLLFIKRSSRYFPIIEMILKKNNVPDDFKYLAVAESGLTNPTSPSNAVGLWQFIKSTGENYKLEINDEVDERYNTEKSTEAACKYLKEAYSIYKSWTLVAASFNLGTNGLTRHLDRQKISNYYDLLLNEETARYVYRILSYKTIMSNPKKYGFYLTKRDLYPPIPTYTVKVDSAITDLNAFAASKNINYKMLKVFNPWLRQNYLTNKNKKTYYIKIPKDNYRNKSYLMEEYLNDKLNNIDTLN